MKKQVVVIHGGDSFATQEEYLAFLKDFEIDIKFFKRRGWKDSLQEKLGDKFEVIALQMPNKFNARYAEWKIWLEKLPPFLNDGVILVGHSLGGTFLVKYLSENKFPKTILGTFLISSPHSLDGDRALGEFLPPESLDLFEKQGSRIFLYHSKDDKVVSFEEFKKYQKIFKNATCRIFTDRGHFNQEEFPEIIDDIKSLK